MLKDHMTISSTGNCKNISCYKDSRLGNKLCYKTYFETAALCKGALESHQHSAPVKGFFVNYVPA